MALGYLHKAGYDPEGLLGFFRTLASYERFNPPLLPGYFSTHPGVSERVRMVSTLLHGAEHSLMNRPPEGATVTRANGGGKASHSVPDGSEDWLRTAIIMRSQVKGLEQSLESLRRMVGDIAGPDVPEAKRHYLLGLALFQADRFVGAVSEFQDAVAQSPENARYRSELAYGYLRLKKINLAWKESVRARELSDQIPLVHLVMGIIQAARGEPERAIHHLTVALDQAPDDLRIHWNLAQTYLEQEDRVLAAFHLGRYARLNFRPDRALEHFRYARDLPAGTDAMTRKIEREIAEILQEGI